MDEQKELLVNVDHLREQNSQQQSVIDQLVKSQNKITALLSPVLERSVENPPSDFEELAKKYVDSVKETHVPPVDSPALLEQIEILQKHIVKLRKRLRSREKDYTAERSRFCQEANDLVTQIEVQNSLQEQKAQAIQGKLEEQIEELRGQLEVEVKSNEQQRKDSQLHVVFPEDTSELKSQYLEVQQKFEEHTAELERLKEEFLTVTEELSCTKTALARKSEKVRELRQKLRDAKECNSQVLMELKTRNDIFVEQYTSQLATLNTENSKLKSTLLSKITELEKIQQILPQTRESNVELQAKQQTLKYRVAELARALDREKESSAAKQKAIANSMKAECDRVIDSLNQTIETARRTLITVLTGDFLVSPLTQTIEGLIEQTNNEISRRASRQALLDDYMKARRILGLENPQDSLVEVISVRDTKLEQSQKEIEELQDAIVSLRASSESNVREIEKLRQAKPEISQWVNWGRKLIAQLGVSVPTCLSPADLRLLLEEACLASVNSRSLTQKLAILRAEKQLLTTPRFTRKFLTGAASARNVISSIRPIMITFLAVRKLQRVCGVLPMRDVLCHGGSRSVKQRT
jgi:chromosome segregation ATPase